MRGIKAAFSSSLSFDVDGDLVRSDAEIEEPGERASPRTRAT